MDIGKAKPGEAGGDPAGFVVLGDFRIRPDQVLPELRSGASLAYRALARDGSDDDYFALICDPASLPRLDAIPAARELEAPTLQTPLVACNVDWPPTGRRHLALLFERPPGGRLVERIGDAIAPVGEDEVVRTYLVPLLSALMALSEAGIVHGSVNPANIFFRDAERTLPLLGECVSTATALRQPAVFAPLEIAMAAPPARGRGQRSDDVFALGMTIAFLLFGGNPAGGKPADELLRQRLEYGSFSALLGDKRVSPSMTELLRGLLADDPKVRWSLGEIEDWIPARRAVSRQGAATKRATRPFEFAETSFALAPALAQAFAADVPTAAAAVRSKEFEIWVHRALSDETSSRLMKQARSESEPEAASERRDDLLVARVVTALDWQGPVRFRELAAVIDGLGGALASAFLGDGAVQTVADAIAMRLPQFWLSARQPPPPEHIALHKIFERLRAQLEDRRFGFGIERVLYELNPTLHCLSPMVEADLVGTLAELLPALERRAVGDFGGLHPIDRHIAAFITTKLKSAAAEWSDAVSSPDPSLRLVGTVRLLARLQALGGAVAVPGLARWVARQAAPLIERYHHRPTRKRLLAELDKAAEAGRLIDLLFILDNPEGERQDAAGFLEARRAHALVAGELKRFGNDGPRRERQASQLAGELSVAFGSAISVAAALASAIVLG